MHSLYYFFQPSVSLQSRLRKIPNEVILKKSVTAVNCLLRLSSKSVDIMNSQFYVGKVIVSWIES